MEQLSQLLLPINLDGQLISEEDLLTLQQDMAILDLPIVMFDLLLIALEITIEENELLLLTQMPNLEQDLQMNF